MDHNILCFCLQCPRSASKLESKGTEKDIWSPWVPPPSARCPWPVPTSAAPPHQAETFQLSPCPLSSSHCQVPCGESRVLVPLTAASRTYGHLGTPTPGQTNLRRPRTWGAGSKFAGNLGTWSLSRQETCKVPGGSKWGIKGTVTVINFFGVAKFIYYSPLVIRKFQGGI